MSVSTRGKLSAKKDASSSAVFHFEIVKEKEKSVSHLDSCEGLYF